MRRGHEEGEDDPERRREHDAEGMPENDAGEAVRYGVHAVPHGAIPQRASLPSYNGFAVVTLFIQAHDAVRAELFADCDAGFADVEKTHGAPFIANIPLPLARIQAATARMWRLKACLLWGWNSPLT